MVFFAKARVLNWKLMGVSWKQGFIYFSKFSENHLQKKKFPNIFLLKSETQNEAHTHVRPLVRHLTVNRDSRKQPAHFIIFSTPMDPKCDTGRSIISNISVYQIPFEVEACSSQVFCGDQTFNYSTKSMCTNPGTDVCVRRSV